MELSLPTRADSKHDHAEHSYALDGIAKVMITEYCINYLEHCSEVHSIREYSTYDPV